jgi:integrase
MPHVSLTSRMAGTLVVPAGKDRVIYFDTHRDAPKGFALRVTARGARSYYLLLTIKGTKSRVWVHIGDAEALSLEDARRAATAKAGDIARDINPNEQARQTARLAKAERLRKEEETQEPTVAELVRRYRHTRLGSLSPVTAAEYERLLSVEIEPSRLGQMKLRDVVRADLRDFLSAISKGKQTWKPAALRRQSPYTAAHLLVLWRAAVKWGHTEEVRLTTAAGDVATRPLFDRLDPSLGIEDEFRLPVRARERTRHLSDAEIVLFWSALDGLRVAWSCFLRLILLVGTRRGETHKARWGDIELDGDSPVWHIPSEHRKGRVKGSRGERKALDVPLSPLAVGLLRELHRVSWMKRGTFIAQGFSLGFVGAEMKLALREAALRAADPQQRMLLEGMSDVTIHDLRRSTARGLERIGAPPHVISLALGHARTAGATATDHHYIGNTRPREVRVWLERWSEHVARLVGVSESGAVVRLLEKRA